MDDSIPQKFYVYTLSNSLTDKVFYVGKGGYEARMGRHEAEARNGVKSYKCNTIRKIWRDGGKVIKKKVAKFADEQDAFIYEWCLINLIYGRENLTNRTDGGEGASGFQPTAAQIERVRHLMHDPVIVAKAREAQKKRWEDPEKRRAKSEHSKHMWSDISFREKQLQRFRSQEVNEKRLKGARKSKNFKTYEGFIAPDGTVYSPVHNLRAFCQKHGLTETCVHDLDAGNLFQHKGWKRLKPINREPKTKPPRAYQSTPFLSPEGIVYDKIQDFPKFCRERGLRVGLMLDLEAGIISQVKGWTCYPPKREIVIQFRDCTRIYRFKSPDGTVFEITKGIKAFYREHNLRPGCMTNVHNGVVKSHRGWTKYDPEGIQQDTLF